MGSFFSKPKIPEPAYVAPPSPAEQDTATKEAAEREAEKIRKRKGMLRRGGMGPLTGTIYTGPRGIEEQPTVLKEKLGQ